VCPDPVNVVRLDVEAYARRRSVKLSLLDLPLRPDQLIELFPPQLRDQVAQLEETAPGTVLGEGMTERPARTGGHRPSGPTS